MVENEMARLQLKKKRRKKYNNTWLIKWMTNDDVFYVSDIIGNLVLMPGTKMKIGRYKKVISATKWKHEQAVGNNNELVEIIIWKSEELLFSLS